MKPFTTLNSIVTPLFENDINTDQIIPSQYLRDVNADLGFGLFSFLRRSPNGEVNLECPFEDFRYRGSEILLVGENFGCGSSREHAVWALQEFGFKCLIGLSFAELFRENCLKNGILPIVLNAESIALIVNYTRDDSNINKIMIDLEKCEILNANRKLITEFSINERERHMLLNGLDDIGLTLQSINKITEWEIYIAKSKPWLTQSISLLS